MNEQKPIALITGASSGIGLELAKLFAQNGHDLVVVAEPGSGLSDAAILLRELGGGRVETIESDLSRLDGAPRVYEQVQTLGLDIDVLVNNAGVGVYGKFTENSVDEEISMVQLNAIATLQMTKFFAPRMVQRGSGRILFTASVASKMPTPWLTVYGATKAFVYELAQGLREELHDTGVTVTALMPGPTDTNFFDRAHAEDSKILDEHLADPAEVAKAGFDAVMKGQDKVIFPLKYKVQSKINAVVPDAVVAKQARRKHEPKEEERRDEQR